jgi:hypothetical protein
MQMKTRAIALSGAAAVGLAGVGLAAGVALADSGSTPTPTPKSSASAAPPAAAGKAAKKGNGKGKPALAGQHILHGEFVTKNKSSVVTVDMQRGSVTAVSPTSITLKSADGFTATYAVTAGAKVRMHGGGKTIADVKVGDAATVLASKNGTALSVTKLSVGEAKKSD